MPFYSKVIGCQSLRSKIIRIAWSLSDKMAMLDCYDYLLIFCQIIRGQMALVHSAVAAMARRQWHGSAAAMARL